AVEVAAVLAELFAVVAGDEDQCVVVEVALLELVDELADEAVGAEELLVVAGAQELAIGGGDHVLAAADVIAQLPPVGADVEAARALIELAAQLLRAVREVQLEVVEVGEERRPLLQPGLPFEDAAVGARAVARLRLPEVETLLEAEARRELMLVAHHRGGVTGAFQPLGEGEH